MRLYTLLIIALVAACTAQAQTNVKIGVLNDRSGLYADLTGEGSVLATQMAVEDFASSGGKFHVEVISGDHLNKPDVGAAIARRWYDRDGVDVIVDVPTSSVALAVGQITREKNKVFIASGAGSADLTGSQCSPNTVHWTYDTVALANGTGGAVLRNGGDTWFFITADYAFGHALERDTTAVVTKGGGKVLGAVRAPFPTNDFSSFLLQAQTSRAKIIGLANAGGDTINAIKQASEFRITQGGQRLAGLLVLIPDIHALGLNVAQGLVLTEAFYWDLNEDTRLWSKKFAERFRGKMPTMAQAGVYAGVLHYLRSVDALKSKDGAAVVRQMKATPTDDPLFGKGTIREDGRKMHPMYLFEVKKPSESKNEWDLYNVLASIPPEQAFRPLLEGGCPLVASSSSVR